MDNIKKLQDKIAELKKKENIVILAHNYQRYEIQEIADFVGDSLDLSIKAKEVPQEVILFCGVNFMAETAKLLSPQKTVLHPVPHARCPMADMVDPLKLKEMKKEYPEAIVVGYVNTTAEVKALCDVCCTSANARKVVEKLEAEEIIFLPDRNLAAFTQKHSSKKIIPWEGFCYVHRKIELDDVKKSKELHPDAILICHPECDPEVLEISDEVASTQGMIKIIEKSSAKKFLIGTEEGLIRRLQKMFPDKEFYSAGFPQICHNMKKISLQDVYESLVYKKYPVEIPTNIAQPARKALERMLEITSS